MSEEKNIIHSDDLAIREISCAAIRIGDRHRKEMGDIEALAESIAAEGLLQPIGVTEDSLLVFGARRLRAIRDVLQRQTILARIVHVSSVLAGEYAENELRKNFTPSERVAIAEAVQAALPERRGPANMENFPELKGRTSRDIAAEKAGLGSGRTYEEAKKVVEHGAPELVAAMDSGVVSISAAAVIAAKPRKQQTNIVSLPADERRKAVRELRGSQKAAKSDLQAQPNAPGPAPAPTEMAPPTATKRQKEIDGVAKRRMIDALSQIRGHCRGLSELSVFAVRHACAAEEISTWAEIAHNAAKELRLFSTKLASTKENKQ